MPFVIVEPELLLVTSRDLRDGYQMIASQNLTSAPSMEAWSLPTVADGVPALAASAHAVTHQVTSAMAAQVHDLSGEQEIPRPGFGSHAQLNVVVSGFFEEVSTCRL